MRILLTTGAIGGVWTFTRELTGQLLAEGHAVALVSFGRLPSQAQFDWCDLMACTYPGGFIYEASDAPLEWMQKNEKAFSEGARVLARVAARFQPDVLHSNQFCWGSLSLDIPKIVTAHSDVMSWAAAVKPEVLRGSKWLTRYRTLVQGGLNSVNAVTAPTEWMRDVLRDNFHVPSRFDVVYNGRATDHPAFYSSSRFTLNLTREDMVAAGYSPSVRLFEASACGAAILSDAWPGMEEFLTPGEEVLLPSDSAETEQILREFSDAERIRLGARARERILAEHTSHHRAKEFERVVAMCKSTAVASY